METLSVGMYVRLNCNYELGIGKTIREIDEDNFIKTKFKDDFECSVPMYMILKASHNIIDLIEEHDILLLFDKEYGKNYKAEVVYDDNNEKCVNNYECTNLLNLGNELFVEDKIKLKSIVTKEQFEAMEYKVESEVK